VSTDHALLLIEVRRLAAAVEVLRESHDHLARRQLERDDRRAGCVLVPLLGDLFYTEPFTAAGAAARGLSDRSATGQALCEFVAEYTAGADLKAFGKLLARLEGVPFDGCRLVRAGKTAGVVRWRVAGGLDTSETPEA
jgi:hypothetical protein